MLLRTNFSNERWLMSYNDPALGLHELPDVAWYLSELTAIFFLVTCEFNFPKYFTECGGVIRNT